MTASADILAMLDASPLLVVFETGVTEVTEDGPAAVYDGSVDTDEEAKIIAVPMPYLVYFGSPGRDNDTRFSGRAGGRIHGFHIHGVGETREQAQWALDVAYDILNRQRLGDTLIKRDEAHMLPRRDDDYNRPGGEPIFYGIDPYNVAV